MDIGFSQWILSLHDMFPRTTTHLTWAEVPPVLLGLKHIVTPTELQMLLLSTLQGYLAELKIDHNLISTWY